MSTDPESGALERLGKSADSKIRKYGSEVLSGGSVLSAAVASTPEVFLGPWPWLGVGAGLGIFAAVVRLRGTESYEAIRADRDAAVDQAVDAIEALGAAVLPLAHNLNEYLGLTESHQRLSVYCHYVGEFRLLARVAKNPNFRATGRASYPEGQGVIGTVWERGDASERIGNGETWLEWVSRFGFSHEEAEALSMKSKNIAAVRLDHNREPVGVVLIESENARGISASQFENLQASYITRSLGEFLSVAGHLMPGGQNNDGS